MNSNRESNLREQLDSATDAVKQVITLSTGVLTLTLTFAKTLAAGADSGWQLALRWSWILLGLAVVAGFWFLLAKTGVVYENKTTDIYDWRLRGPWLVQVVLFLLAIILIFSFGFTQFGDIPDPADGSSP
jgi:hypothetical protein